MPTMRPMPEVKNCELGRAFDLSRSLSFLLGALATLIACCVFVIPDGLLKAFDWALHIAWIEQFYQSLASGIWRPGWLQDAENGFGSPVFVYYPPAAYYLASVYRLLSGDAVLALKLTQTTAVFLSYSTSYWLFCRLGERAGSAALFAVACALSPAVFYIAFRVHMPAATLSYAMLPFVMAPFLAPFERNTANIITASSAIGLIAWTHLPTLLIAVTCVAALVGFRLLFDTPRDFRKVQLAATSLAAGLALGAGAIAPAVFEGKFASLHVLIEGATDWRTNFLLVRPESIGFRADYTFLSVVACAAACGLVVVLSRWRRLSPRAKIAAGVALVTFCMTTPASWLLYALVPPFQQLQFPWRWLPLCWLATCVALSCGLTARKSFPAIAVAMSALTLVGLLAANDGTLLPARPRTTEAEARWFIGVMPRDVPEYRPNTLTTPAGLGAGSASANPFSVQHAGVSHKILSLLPQSRSVLVVAEEPHRIRFGIACFPGWRAQVDGIAVEVACDGDGTLAVDVPSGEHQVEIEFGASPVRAWAQWLSLATVLVLLAFFAKESLKRWFNPSVNVLAGKPRRSSKG